MLLDMVTSKVCFAIFLIVDARRILCTKCFGLVGILDELNGKGMKTSPVWDKDERR